MRPERATKCPDRYRVPAWGAVFSFGASSTGVRPVESSHRRKPVSNARSNASPGPGTRPPATGVIPAPSSRRKPKARKTEAGGLTARLGIVGWQTLDPILLAALATEFPLLLVGAHGTAKSMVVERVAAALGQEFRHYNASLLNYDDLLGIPLPDEQGGGLRFVGTAGAIWGAAFVLIDEISRCRADLQNKFFPIIHERRVAGLPLPDLRHRWAAMNPPSPDTPEGPAGADAVYLGSEPLDPALCDRFPFVVRVPGWSDLNKDQRRELVTGAGRAAGAGAWLPGLVAETRRRARRLEEAPPERLADYLVQFLAELERAGLPQSPRRARTFFSSILAVHAAREVLEGGPTDFEVSAHLAVRCGLPQTATETPPGAAVILVAHRQAWEVSGLGQDSFWRQVLEEKDPVERVLIGARKGVAEKDLARLVIHALAAEPDEAGRIGLATAMFLAFRETHALTPAAWEPLSRLAARVLVPRRMAGYVSIGPEWERWQEISLWAAEREVSGNPEAGLERHFVLGCFPDVWSRADWKEALRRFSGHLRRFEVAAACGPAGGPAHPAAGGPAGREGN